MSAHAGADTRGELSTDECRRVIDEIARVNPNVFLILTGGEPLLRRDIWDVAGYASGKGFTTVLGTNGVLLREREAKLMREHGVLGASISWILPSGPSTMRFAICRARGMAPSGRRGC